MGRAHGPLTDWRSFRGAKRAWLSTSHQCSWRAAEEPCARALAVTGAEAARLGNLTPWATGSTLCTACFRLLPGQSCARQLGVPSRMASAASSREGRVTQAGILRCLFVGGGLQEAASYEPTLQWAPGDPAGRMRRGVRGGSGGLCLQGGSGAGRRGGGGTAGGSAGCRGHLAG